jgi:hypothetical protein
MCKKWTRFIESRAMVMAWRGRRGANELATLRHVLEKRDELGKKREYKWGIKYTFILKLVFTSVRSTRSPADKSP